jgi:hypothetical protein
MQVRWKRIIVIVLCAVIGISCSDLHASHPAEATQANGEPRMSGIVMVLELSPRLAPWEEAAIEDAASDWTLSTEGVADIRFDEPIVRKTGWQYDRVFVRPVDSDELLLAYIDVLIGGNAVGLTDLYGYLSSVPTVYIARDRIGSDEEYRSVVEHELGHTIGLMHDTDPNALMWPYNNGTSACISVSDLKQFCGLYECSVDMPEERGCNSDLMCH